MTGGGTMGDERVEATIGSPGEVVTGREGERTPPVPASARPPVLASGTTAATVAGAETAFFHRCR